MARSKLRDRLANAAGLAVISEEPHVTIPPVDKGEALAAVATQGIAAIEVLVEERNSMVRTAASVHRENVHVTNVNNTLRMRCDYLERRCEILIRSNARLGGIIGILHDIFKQVGGEVADVTAKIENMPKPPHVSNHPDMPPCDAQGIPIEDEPRDQFDAEGRPLNLNGVAAPQPTLKELTEQIAALDQPVS